MLRLDRLSSDSLTMMQELIANMLSVRREGVTETTGNLRRPRLIRCRRSHIEVIDRPELAGAVCECCAAVELEFDNLLTSIPQSDPIRTLGQSDRHSLAGRPARTRADNRRNNRPITI